MKLFRSRQFLLGTAVTLLAAPLLFLFSPMTREIDRAALNIQYRLRGESRVDSSVVILYFDNDAIASLGGWPLKRSYYALLVDAMHQLGAAAIGFDIAFDQPGREYPEYDDLFASMTKRAGNVVFGGYFQILDGDTLSAPMSSADSLPDRFTFGTCGPYKIRTGRNITKPIPSLLDAAAGFGHSNLTADGDIPLLVRLKSGRYALSFAEAVLLAALRNRGVRPESPELVPSFAGPLRVPGRPNGDISIDFRGGV